MIDVRIQSIRELYYDRCPRRTHNVMHATFYRSMLRWHNTDHSISGDMLGSSTLMKRRRLLRGRGGRGARGAARGGVRRVHVELEVIFRMYAGVHHDRGTSPNAHRLPGAESDMEYKCDGMCSMRSAEQ
jgi:hypothetical protein